MLGNILGGKVKVPMVAHDIIDDALQLARLHLEVGSNAATLTHLAAVGRVEYMRGAVGRSFLVSSIGVTVAIVHFLNEASTGDIVLGNGNLEHPVIRQRTCRLHQSLAKRTRTDDDGTVQVLQGARGDFAGTGRTAVDKYSQRYLGVNRINGGLVGALT